MGMAAAAAVRLPASATVMKYLSVRRFMDAPFGHVDTTMIWQTAKEALDKRSRPRHSRDL